MHPSSQQWWEAEIVIPGQPEQKQFAKPHLHRKARLILHACHPSDGGKFKTGASQSSLAWA
jgi:hypothetical protein